MTSIKVLYNKKYFAYARSMRWLMVLLATFTSCSRETPLSRAAAHGSELEVRHALAGASVQDAQGALIAAVRNGNVNVIPLLQKAGADLTTAAGVNDWTPLEHAVHKRQLNSVKALLAAGAPVNQIDSHRRTALIWAAGNGYTEIVRVLLAKGADPRMQDEQGENALDYAVSGITDIDNFTAGKCQTDTVRAILAASPGLKPTHASGKTCGEIQQLIASTRQVPRN